MVCSGGRCCRCHLRHAAWLLHHHRLMHSHHRLLHHHGLLHHRWLHHSRLHLLMHHHGLLHLHRLLEAGVHHLRLMHHRWCGHRWHHGSRLLEHRLVHSHGLMHHRHDRLGHHHGGLETCVCIWVGLHPHAHHLCLSLSHHHLVVCNSLLLHHGVVGHHMLLLSHDRVELLHLHLLSGHILLHISEHGSLWIHLLSICPLLLQSFNLVFITILFGLIDLHVE